MDIEVKGKRIGYIRVSTVDQKLDRQLEKVKVDRMFEDKITGSKTDRPGLNALLEYVRDGDHVFVHSIDRLARNVMDLNKLIKDLIARDVGVSFIKENLVFTSDDSRPMDKFLLNVLGSFAEFEREMMLERQREGISIARQKGKYKGRLPSLTRSEAAQLRIRAESGITKTRLAHDFKIDRKTLYKYLEPDKHPTLRYRDDPMYLKVPEGVK